MAKAKAKRLANFRHAKLAGRRKRRLFDPEITPDALRLWRVTKNLTNPVWSQEYTAAWLGVSLRSYARWEQGKYPAPLYVTLRITEHETMSQRIAALEDQLRRNNIMPSPP